MLKISVAGRQEVSLKISLRYCIVKEISILYHSVKILKVPIPVMLLGIKYNVHTKGVITYTSSPLI